MLISNRHICIRSIHVCIWTDWTLEIRSREANYVLVRFYMRICGRLALSNSLIPARLRQQLLPLITKYLSDRMTKQLFQPAITVVLRWDSPKVLIMVFAFTFIYCLVKLCPHRDSNVSAWSLLTHKKGVACAASELNPGIPGFSSDAAQARRERRGEERRGEERRREEKRREERRGGEGKESLRSRVLHKK